MQSRFLPVAIGLRYVRSRDAGFFVSFSSWLSLAGVCVGVAALITSSYLLPGQLIPLIGLACSLLVLVTGLHMLWGVVRRRAEGHAGTTDRAARAVDGEQMPRERDGDPHRVARDECGRKRQSGHPPRGGQDRHGVLWVWRHLRRPPRR